VLGVGPDRSDHEVELIGAIGFARHAMGDAAPPVSGSRGAKEAEE
jgi:hypothetical protein